MDTRDIYKLVRELSEERDDVVNLYDSVDLELNEGFVIETGVVGFMEDGVIVHLDEDAMEFLDFNGVLLESVDAYDSEGASEAVFNAIIGRISRQHVDLLGKYGPAAVQAAVEDVASGIGDVEEIGSSDVSIWVREVIKDLEAGNYKHIDEADDSVDVEQELAFIPKSEDPFDLVYRYLSGDGGPQMQKAIQAMYDEIVIDSQGRLHPDDDVETIIDRILDNLEGDYGVEDEHLAEIAAIKKLALGESKEKDCPHCDGTGGHDKLTSRDGYHTVPCKKCGGSGKVDADDEDLNEGLGKVLLGGAALIAAITGVNKMQAAQMMKSEPQLVALAQMRQEAEAKGDQYKVKELDDRIEQTMDHIRVTGRPVMGDDGEPVNPREPVGEAEYQGRKVPLNKPMQGDVKKSKVYVKKPNGKVVKVNFGDKNMTIKKSNPERRKSFRARHHCENPGPKWKARYWSCRAW